MSRTERQSREPRAREERDLLQAVDGASAQLGVLLLGDGEAFRHGLEVGGVGGVRPAAVEPDLCGCGDGLAIAQPLARVAALKRNFAYLGRDDGPRKGV